MPDLKRFWRQRYDGWFWPLVPVLAAIGLALLLLPAAPSAGQIAGFVLLALLLLGLGALAVWRIGAPFAQLLDAARQLASGRYEGRAPADRVGASGELAEHLNTLGRQLAQQRDLQDQQVARASGRLRLDLERAQEQNQTLRTALDTAESSVRAQSELFANLSHELRTPLTAILGYADLLQRSGLNPEQTGHLSTLDKSARSLLAMINDLLDWSRIEAGRLRLNEEPFDLTDTVEDTIALLAPLAYDKDLELVRIVYHDVPRRLSGDAQRLRQILTNLLSNAIKFTERGEVVLRVMREREEQGRVWLRFAIADTGVGIAPAQQARLFQAFQQVGRASATGSGLGLSITLRLAELMGGRVEVESIPGRGSTFSATASFGLTVDADLQPVTDPRLRERGVWLLEPHPTARLALTHWLEFWGMRVKGFASATELLDSLEHAGADLRPDVVVLGLKQSLAGDAVVLRLMASARSHATPLLVLVASASLEVQERLRQAGASACHPKAIGRQALQDELLRLMAAEMPRTELPLSGRRVLIADNNLPNRRYLAALCSGLGLEPIEAVDGQDALERWLAGRQDLVLLDARMPRLDGPGCAREIRRAERGPSRCRILAVSAHLEPDERRAFLEAGADEVLIKPFDDRQLLRALAPAARTQPAPTASVLADDPEMLALLHEDLPQQYAALEAACNAGDLEAARSAAHHLRGTAAFYHLAGLRQATAALELWLKRATTLRQQGGAMKELQLVRQAVQETLKGIQQKRVAS